MHHCLWWCITSALFPISRKAQIGWKAPVPQMYRWVWLYGCRTRMKLEHSFWKRNETWDIKTPCLWVILYNETYSWRKDLNIFIYEISVHVYVVILPVKYIIMQSMWDIWDLFFMKELANVNISLQIAISLLQIIQFKLSFMLYENNVDTSNREKLWRNWNRH